MELAGFFNGLLIQQYAFNCTTKKNSTHLPICNSAGFFRINSKKNDADTENLDPAGSAETLTNSLARFSRPIL